MATNYQTAIRCGKCRKHPARCQCNKGEPSPVDPIVLRYCQHLEATAGEKTKEAFSKSPYFVKGSGEWWEWNEHQLRLDQAALARAFVELEQ